MYKLLICAALGLGVVNSSAAAPQQVAELVLHGLPSHPKWIPEAQPPFGSYLASGDGEASGAVTGHVFWDLYEDQSQAERHPAFFRGFVEHDGRRYPFEIALYTPESVDRKRWRISGAIAFADKAVLGTEQQPIIGRWEAGTSHFAIWAGHDSR